MSNNQPVVNSIRWYLSDMNYCFVAFVVRSSYEYEYEYEYEYGGIGQVVVGYYSLKGIVSISFH